LTDILVNERIRVRTVRLIDGDKQLGIFPLNEALSRAYRQGLDLVMVAAGDPPVCRIVEAGRFVYERKKAEREQARRRRVMMVETKEIQLRPVTDDNDLLIKAKRARGFLDEGDKVKVIVKFKGRERSHKEWGRQVIQRFLSAVGGHKVDKPLADGEADLTIVLGSLISKSELVKRKLEVI
jgi:translation initiation factor IF-3